MKLPTEIDEKVCVFFSMHSQIGYECGYNVLDDFVDKEVALFTTFCHWLLDEHTGNRIEIDGNFLEIKERTFPTSFGKDYKYEFELKGKLFDYEFNLQIGEYSRYNVGLGTYLSDMVEKFAHAVGRYERHGFQGLIELNHLITE